MTNEPKLNEDGLPLCSRCGQVFVFELDEPFADCGCGTTEWGYSGDIYRMRQEKYELVLDYTVSRPPPDLSIVHKTLNQHSTPEMMRRVVLTNELSEEEYVKQDPIRKDLVILFDAKRAWILPDDKLAVERYYQERFTILSNWTVLYLDGLGQTINERRNTPKL